MLSVPSRSPSSALYSPLHPERFRPKLRTVGPNACRAQRPVRLFWGAEVGASTGTARLGDEDAKAGSRGDVVGVRRWSLLQHHQDLRGESRLRDGR